MNNRNWTRSIKIRAGIGLAGMLTLYALNGFAVEAFVRVLSGGAPTAADSRFDAAMFTVLLITDLALTSIPVSLLVKIIYHRWPRHANIPNPVITEFSDKRDLAASLQGRWAQIGALSNAIIDGINSSGNAFLAKVKTATMAILEMLRWKKNMPVIVFAILSITISACSEKPPVSPVGTVYLMYIAAEPYGKDIEDAIIIVQNILPLVKSERDKLLVIDATEGKEIARMEPQIPGQFGTQKVYDDKLKLNEMRKYWESRPSATALDANIDLNKITRHLSDKRQEFSGQPIKAIIYGSPFLKFGQADNRTMVLPDGSLLCDAKAPLKISQSPPLRGVDIHWIIPSSKATFINSCHFDGTRRTLAAFFNGGWGARGLVTFSADAADVRRLNMQNLPVEEVKIDCSKTAVESCDAPVFTIQYLAPPAPPSGSASPAPQKVLNHKPKTRPHKLGKPICR